MPARRLHLSACLRLGLALLAAACIAVLPAAAGAADAPTTDTAPPTAVGTPQRGCVSSAIWYDVAADGVRGGGEVGAAGRLVQLVDAAGTQLAVTTTDTNGDWSACSAAIGTACTARIALPAGFELGTSPGSVAAAATDTAAAAALTPCAVPAAGTQVPLPGVGLVRTPDLAEPGSADARRPGVLAASVVDAARLDLLRGQTARFTVRLKNRGGTPLTNVVACVAVPPHLTLVAKVTPNAWRAASGRICTRIARLGATRSTDVAFAVRAGTVSARRCAFLRISTAATRRTTRTLPFGTCVSPYSAAQVRAARRA